jgi:hypothetical protein
MINKENLKIKRANDQINKLKIDFLIKKKIKKNFEIDLFLIIKHKN